MRVSNTILAYFFENMSFMMDVGFSVMETLDTIIENSAGRGRSEKAMHQIAMQLQADVLSGYSLHEAMERHSKIFGQSYPKQIRAGEHSGKLPETLARISAQIQEAASTTNRIRTALVYPTIVLIVTLAISIYLFTAVIPQMMDMIAEMGVGTIPTLSIIIMSISDFIVAHWLMLLITSGMFIIGLTWLLRGPLRMPFQHFVLCVPAFGQLALNTDYLSFYRSMQYLIMAGLPISEVLETSIAGVKNGAIRDQLTTARRDLTDQGRPLSDVLASVSTISRLEVQAIIAGEKSGKLSETFAKLARRKNEQSEQTTKVLIAAMDPALMLIVGVIVGVVVIAVYLPTISMAF